MSARIVNCIDRPWIAVLFVAIIMVNVMGLQLSAHDWDPSYFIAIGDRYIRQPDQLPDNVHIMPNSSGYDGQFYYQLALNPFSPQAVNAGLSISNGPYRQQRIIYPLLVWLLSFGNRELVPTMLVVVNFVALCIMSWLGARFAQLHERHALWGTLFALYPGFLFTITRDLTEIVGAMFLLMAILALYHKMSNTICALLFALAMFSRETAIIPIAALGVALILNKRDRWIGLQVVAIPLVYFGIWQGALWSKWGRLPILAGGHNIGVPGAGIVEFIRSLDLGFKLHRTWSSEFGLVALIMLLAAVVALRKSNIPLWLKLMWLGYAVLALSLTHHVWIEDIAFMRALSEVYLFSLMLVIASGVGRGILTSVGAGTVIIWTLMLIRRLDW